MSLSNPQKTSKEKLSTSQITFLLQTTAKYWAVSYRLLYKIACQCRSSTINSFKVTQVFYFKKRRKNAVNVHYIYNIVSETTMTSVKKHPKGPQHVTHMYYLKSQKSHAKNQTA